jgi:hypothetical protein
MKWHRVPNEVHRATGKNYQRITYPVFVPTLQSLHDFRVLLFDPGDYFFFEFLNKDNQLICI